MLVGKTGPLNALNPSLMPQVEMVAQNFEETLKTCQERIK